MTLPIRTYLTFGMAMLCSSAVVVVSAPVALAEGGLGGQGAGTVTGPGGVTLGTVTSQLTGMENIPGGTTGAPSCLAGACSGSLTTVTGIVTGPSGTAPPPTSLQITPTVNLPQPNAIACITAICHGNGGLGGTGSVQTPIVGVSGGLNGYIHG